MISGSKCFPFSVDIVVVVSCEKMMKELYPYCLTNDYALFYSYKDHHGWVIVHFILADRPVDLRKNKRHSTW